MAADVYLSEAANRVREAVGALHEDIHKIQSESYRTEAQLHSDVQRAENEVVQIKAEIALTADVSHRAVLEARVRQLDAEAHDKKAEITKIGSDAARTVQSKTSLLSGLESTASHLESMAASAR